jgi:hypothetical protein
VFFMTQISDCQASSGQPWTRIFAGDRLKPEWRNLMVAHPDRFILAFDNVFPGHWSGKYVQQAQLWRKALSDLPPPVAHAVAQRNAERLWRLPPAQAVGASATN